MLSFTIQSPLSNRLSLGNCVRFGSLSSYISPGTSSPELIYFPNTRSAMLGRVFGWTYKSRFEGLSRHTRSAISHAVFSWSIQSLNRSVHLSYDTTHRTRLNQCSRDATNGHEEDTHCVVVVCIQRPENQASNLEDVERV